MLLKYKYSYDDHFNPCCEYPDKEDTGELWVRDEQHAEEMVKKLKAKYGERFISAQLTEEPRTLKQW